MLAFRRLSRPNFSRQDSRSEFFFFWQSFKIYSTDWNINPCGSVPTVHACQLAGINVGDQLQDQYLRLPGDASDLYLSTVIPETSDMSCYIPVSLPPHMPVITMRVADPCNRLLPAIGRQIVMSILYVEAPIPLKDIQSWVYKDGHK